MGRKAAVMDWEQKFPFLREKGHVVSLIGGGGKTTLLYVLSAYCTAKGWRVLTATTTHIRKPVNVPWIAVNEEEKTASLECESSECKTSVGIKCVCENTAWENAGKERDRLWQQGTYVVAGTPAPHEKLTILPEASGFRMQISHFWRRMARNVFRVNSRRRMSR